jgi:glycosyltransferase involved in cell wall biosynthesis
MRVFRPSVGSVRHYIAGGHEHGGGIGRLAGNILSAPGKKSTHIIKDTRGVGWNPLYSPFFLLSALVVLMTDRVSEPGRLHHIHIAGRGSTARKLILGTWAHWLGCSYILHLHDYDYEADYLRRPEWQQRAIRKLFKRAEHVIVLGQRDFRMVHDVLKVPTDKLSVVRNCVPDPGQNPKKEGDTVEILFLGRLGPRKGVPELLHALSHPDMPDDGWRATLAGDGPVEQYRQDVADLNLENKVNLPGWLDEPTTRSLCARSDILVLPSHAEGFAMAVLEGLAHELVVVTTRVGAHDEVLQHDESCVFVPVGDATALAHTLSDLIRNPTKRARIAEQGRQLYLSGFGIGGYVEQLDALYGKLGQASRYAEVST